MYHCHLHIYYIGRHDEIAATLRDIPPLEPFSHGFSSDAAWSAEALAAADVIFAEPESPEALSALIAGKKPEAELILLAEQNALPPAETLSEAVRDIWLLPMDEAELRFRFRKWQRDCKAEKDLWETRQYLDTIINSVPNLVWYKDKTGVHEKVNDSFCRTVRKTKEQVQGQRHAYIWDVEEDDPACIESERIVMETRQTQVSEELVQTGDGERLLTTYKSPLYDWDGSVMGTVGVAIDVTQERLYEQELLENTRALESLFTSLDCGIMCHSLDGTRVISVNRAALEILGYDSQAELMADGFSMVASTVLDEDKPRLRESIMSLQKEGDSVSVEYRVQHKNGRLLYVMGNIKLVREGDQLFYQRFLLDITAQQLQAQEKEMMLQRLHQDLLQALATDYNLVCFFDLDTGMGEAVRIHNCQYNVLDSVFSGALSLDTCMEHYISSCVYEDDRDSLRQALSQEHMLKELAEKNIFYINYRARCGGNIRYFQLKAVRAGSWEKVHGAVLGFRSVDEETRIEMEKKTQLEDALSQANRASRAKSVFLSNMSHDIRTPMNAIIGFTALATTHIDSKERVAEYLKKIMTSGNHLLSLINNVLDMSHIESGKMNLDEKPASLQDILHGLKNIVQSDIQAKQLELHMDAPELQHESVYCDRLRLNQMLLNLLGNAIKYTPAGGTVSLCVTEKPGAPAGCGSYEFRITDTGIGMSEEFISHIFEPFEREQNSTLSGVQGTGLGMAITKNILDMMHGTIDIKSKQGKGTEVTVSLSFRLCGDGGEPQPLPEPAVCQTPEPAPVPSRTGHILLTEDNELNQEIAQAILEEAGFTVDIAENGQIAVDMLRRSQPGQYQLILMDVQMPVMNGYDATRAIRALENPALASIPILAMTANAFEEDKQAALASGMDGHIAKPIDIPTLLETLDAILC